MLSRLDAIALNVLCDHLKFDNIVQLLMTGDGILQQKLCDAHVVTRATIVAASNCNTNKLLLGLSSALICFKSLLDVTVSVKRDVGSNLETTPSCATMAKFAKSLPLSVKTLVVDTPVTAVDKEFFKCLPRNLERLKLFGDFEDAEKCLSRLPPSLTWLKIDGHRDLSCTNLFLCLPKNLQYLEMPSLVGPSNLDFAFLPRTLETLCLKNVRTFNDDIVPLLPSGLTCLDLSSAKYLTDTCIPLLPRTLKRLALTSNWTMPYCFSQACLEHLPPYLEWLAIFVRMCGRSSHQHLLGNLPASLRHLRLTLDNGTACTAFPHLPRNLVELSFWGDTEDLTAEALQQLPANLRHFELGSGESLTNALVAFLPRQLQTISVFNSVLTEACAGDLPLALRLLELPPLRRADECRWIGNYYFSNRHKIV